MMPLPIGLFVLMSPHPIQVAPIPLSSFHILTEDCLEELMPVLDYIATPFAALFLDFPTSALTYR